MFLPSDKLNTFLPTVGAEETFPLKVTKKKKMPCKMIAGSPRLLGEQGVQPAMVRHKQRFQGLLETKRLWQRDFFFIT